MRSLLIGLTLLSFAIHSAEHIQQDPTFEDSNTATNTNGASEQTVISDKIAITNFVELTQEVKDFEAYFEQSINDQFGNTVDESAGKFVLAKPNRFIWQTELPFEQLIISNGKTLWTYDQDLEQVSIQSLNTAIGNTPVLLIEATAEELRGSFKVKQLISGSSTAQTFELLPIDSQYAFERMLVQFKDRQLTEILLLDTLGQQTVVTFSQIKQNQEMTSDRFEFRIPDGVDVVDSREVN